MRRAARQSGMSISRGLTLITMAVSLPILLFLIYSNTYLTAKSREQTLSLVRESLTLYQTTVDARLKNHDTYLIDFMNSNTDVVRMTADANSDEALLARIRIQNRFRQSVVYYSDVCGFFVYDIATQKEAFTFVSPSDDALRLLRALERDLQAGGEGVSYAAWFPYQTEDAAYVVRLLRTGTTCVGTAIACENLMPSTGDAERYALLSEDGAMVYGDWQGTALGDGVRVRMDGHEGTLVGVRSAAARYQLMQMVWQEDMNVNLDIFQLITGAATVFFLLMLIVQQVYHRRQIISPLNVAADAMRRVRDGDMQAQLVEKPGMLEEIALVYRSFNQMTGEIARLKIGIYEERLKRQRAALQFLQLQNKPHFFSNALQLINAMVEKKQYGDIPRIVALIAQYMRYSLSGQANVVALLDELRHVEDYIELIHYSKGGREILLEQHVDPHLLHLAIPPLMIQTFVENSVNYGCAQTGPMVFSLQCGLANGRLRVEMADNGGGFSEHILRLHAEGKRIIDERGEHIGISNIAERLRILFGEDAMIELSNREGSAHILIDMKAIEINEYDANR